MIWADNLAIPVDAPNSDGALAYINHMLAPPTASMDTQIKLHGAKPPSAALAQLRKEAWERVKAAH